MVTIRNDISKKNKFWVPKYRYMELKYMCMQYEQMKKDYAALSNSVKAISMDGMPRGSGNGRPTEDIAIRRMMIAEKISAIDKAASEAAGQGLLRKMMMYSIVNEVAYDYLELHFKKIVPVSRKTFYQKRRKFFWILDKII